MRLRIQHPAGVAMNCMQASPAQTHPAGNRTMETKRRPALHRSSPPDTLQGTVLWKPSVGQPYTGPHPRTPCREPCYGNQAQASPTQVLTLGHPAGNRTMETKRRPALHRSSPSDTLQGTVLWKPTAGQPSRDPHPRNPSREPCRGNRQYMSRCAMVTLIDTYERQGRAYSGITDKDMKFGCLRLRKHRDFFVSHRSSFI